MRARACVFVCLFARGLVCVRARLRVRANVSVCRHICARACVACSGFRAFLVGQLVVEGLLEVPADSRTEGILASKYVACMKVLRPYGCAQHCTAERSRSSQPHNTQHATHTRTLHTDRHTRTHTQTHTHLHTHTHTHARAPCAMPCSASPLSVPLVRSASACTLHVLLHVAFCVACCMLRVT